MTPTDPVPSVPEAKPIPLPRSALRPKIFTAFQGYNRHALWNDLMAGAIVGIVALPLAIAFAIASGVSPDKGLITAVVAGFLISALSGSRVQIGGPTGAFVVIVYGIVQKYGVDGLMVSTLMAGVFLIGMGLAGFGSFIKFIPYPVTVGFTAGIAVIIFSSQIRDLFGLSLDGKEPGELIPKLQALGRALPTFNPAAAALAAVAVAIILALRHFRPSWPGILIAVVISAVAAWLLGLPVETIGTKFGGIPQSFPWPSLPAFSLAKLEAVLPDAISFALLGAIESLLSAVVADGMTGRRHRSNCELVAQGIANIGASLFGGICVTGTIARTATNIRAGAYGPVSGMLHAVFLLAFMLLAAPLASYIPLAALAGVLAVVAYNMVEKEAFAALLRSSRGDALVLLVTFALVIFRDLTESIVVG